MTRTPRHRRTTTPSTGPATGLATGLAAALVVTLTGCGSTEPDTDDSGDASSARGAGRDSSPAAPAGGEEREEITPGGIAVVVLDHLGQPAVRQFLTYEPEPGSVGVVVRLREGAGAENVAVTVYSPGDASEFAATDVCASKRRERAFGDVRCRRLDDGTSVMTSEVAEGFSDDNTHGMVVFGTAVRPDDGAAMVMYESYDDSPAVSTGDLGAILADPRLRWLTQRQVNRAGDHVHVKHLG